MEETAVMLCISKKQTEGNPNLYIYPGSTEVPCTDCGEAVIISPGSRGAMKRIKVLPICPGCWIKRVKAEKEPVDFQILPETAREVELWRKKRN